MDQMVDCVKDWQFRRTINGEKTENFGHCTLGDTVLN